MSVICAGDRALVAFQYEQTISPPFLARVEFSPRSCLVLRCPRSCSELFPQGAQPRIMVRFLGDRARFIAMHRAIDAISLDVLFPAPIDPPTQYLPLSFFDSRLVEEQKRFSKHSLRCLLFSH